MVRTPAWLERFYSLSLVLRRVGGSSANDGESLFVEQVLYPNVRACPTMSFLTLSQDTIPSYR